MPDYTRYLLKPQRITHNNDVRLLVNGRVAYPAMLEAIGQAQDTISLETYILASDTTGWRFAEALAERARQGVEVNVLLDGLGSMGCSDRLIRALTDAGARVTWYKPLAPWRQGWGWWRRDHKKILVVDGHVGFVGGLNVADEYADWECGGKGWRDTHARLAGPVVRQLQRSFLLTWRKAKGPPLVEERYLPLPKDAGGADAVVITNRIYKERRQIRRAYMHALKRAQSCIYLTSAYFVPGRGIRRRLRKACRRGVDVQILLAGVSDIGLVTRAARHTYQPLLKCGVRIFEWAGPMMHAKTAVVDGRWATVGSCNLDFLSMRYNLESNVVALGETLAAPLTRQFREDLEHATEIRLEEWRRRPWSQRFLDTLAYRLRRWL
ncbi:MAG: phospholipase D-like domain-containing protein [bacterium]